MPAERLSGAEVDALFRGEHFPATEGDVAPPDATRRAFVLVYDRCDRCGAETPGLWPARSAAGAKIKVEYLCDFCHPDGMSS